MLPNKTVDDSRLDTAMSLEENTLTECLQDQKHKYLVRACAHILQNADVARDNLHYHKQIYKLS